METNFLVKINETYKDQVVYLTNIATQLQEAGFNFNVEVTDVEMVQYYKNDELYVENAFLNEDGLLTYIDAAPAHECSGCGGGCHS